ncbi:MAG TPA: ABC transporter permease [Thermoanaerobaculia bacterium]|nr:ABC transporter permease [Thermoanaerobaculia bacterium]
MLLNDLRRAFRGIGTHPTRSLVTVLTFGLAIGVNSAIFSLVNAALLQPLPFEDPDRLVMVWTQFTQQDRLKGKLSEPELADLRQSGAFSGVGAFATQKLNLTGVGEPQQVSAALVTTDLLSVLGQRPAIGRGFLPEEGRPGGRATLLLSHGFWQRQFGADPGLVGRTLNLDGQPFEIVGVLPREGRFPDADVWVPLTLGATDPATRGAHYLEGVARVPATPERSQAELTALAARLQQDHPSFYPAGSGWGLRAVPLREEQTGEIRPALLVILCAGGLVLLIACGNIANLWLIQVWGRRKDLAVQVAFGATRGRIVRQLLTESLVMGVSGGLLGLVLAHWSLPTLLALAPADAARRMDVPFDLNVFVFSLAISLLVGALAGLVPALQATRGMAEMLKQESGRSSQGTASRRLRGALVMAEMALALLVVIGAGLLVKNLSKLYRVDPGFNVEGVLTVSLSLPATKYQTGPQVSSFYQELLRQVRSVPGVESASAVSHLPLSGQDYSGDFTVEGVPYDTATGANEAARRAIGPGYFQTMGIPVVAGRGFTEGDSTAVIVDELLARRFWPDGSALGKRLKLGKPDSEDPWLTVVGVAGHVKHKGLDAESRPQMYFPLSQMPRPEMFLVLRSASADPAVLAASVRAEILEIDPDQPVARIRTMEEWLGESLSRQRFATLLLASFALLGLVLAGIGIYAVMASSTAERTQEIGIRVAMGASPRDILEMVFRQSLAISLIGLGAGLGAALAFTPVLTNQLHGLSPLDPWVYTAAAALLLATALVATYIPARRTLRLNPNIALRRA